MSPGTKVFINVATYVWEEKETYKILKSEYHICEWVLGGFRFTTVTRDSRCAGSVFGVEICHLGLILAEI